MFEMAGRDAQRITESAVDAARRAPPPGVVRSQSREPIMPGTINTRRCDAPAARRRLLAAAGSPESSSSARLPKYSRRLSRCSPRASASNTAALVA